MSTESPPELTQGNISFLHLGFRPFFFGALAFAILSIMIWMFQFTFHQSVISAFYPMIAWHAHEMIFGFSTAVIAGFLLTAVKNWTKIQTLHQTPLLLVFLIWLAPRALPLVDASWAIGLLAFLDCSFILLVGLAYAAPVVKKKLWKNASFIVAFVALFIGNLLYYLGLFRVIDKGIHWGLYIGFYVVIAVVFHLGRRVIPFFFRKALNGFEVKNYAIVDKSIWWIFLAFAISEIFFPRLWAGSLTAMMLALLVSARLVGWYHKDIWKIPLVWVLYLAYVWFVIGFLLRALSSFFQISPFLSVHAFSYGGIGLIIAGMIARVSLGHTGNSVYHPPAILPFAFGILFLGATTRVLLPLFLKEYYLQLIGLSQVLWMIAFLILFVIYAPMLVKVRADGKYG